MLKQVVGSVAVALVFAGCGLPPEEEDDTNDMPTEAELKAEAAAAPSQIASFAAGDQTRRETGIYTWKIHKNPKNLLIGGYNKNGKRIFRNWIWPTKRSEKGLSSLYMGPAAKLDSFGQAQGHKVHVGARMSAAKRKLHKQVMDGLTRDFKKQPQGRFSCASDSVLCGISTAGCVGTANVVACLAAAAECATAFESCGTNDLLLSVADAIGEGLSTLSENCERDPFICTGT